MVRTGLDIAHDQRWERWRGKRIGVLCHQATVDRQHRQILDLLLPLHSADELTIEAAFGPQHGLWGHTQDNMIEWEGYTDPRTGLRFHSLYGEHREPTDEMLAGLDEMVIDIQDVGCRVYTFNWTIALTMKACARNGIPVTILDRPNPIGSTVEGPGLDPEFTSFVGLHPIPMRHGKTAGELARQIRDEYYSDCELNVVSPEGHDPAAYLDEQDSVWAVPSPNMPTVDTAVVYPGMVLLEGTNLTEGRGTTRPFEMFGAPWIDGWKLADELAGLEMPGCTWRPIQFEPTYQKHAKEICQGCFLHVTERRAFRPAEAACRMLAAVWRLWPNDMGWIDPPYEYEYEKLPIDILLGDPRLRMQIEQGEDVRIGG